MTNIRKLIDLFDDIEHSEPSVGDIVEIECGDTLIETTIADITEEGVIIHVDETIMKMFVEGKKQLHEEKTRLDPKCWKGKKIGNPKTKMKGGVRVNNCVPKESIDEAEYQGRKVSLGKPFLTPDGPKKRSVYVKNAKGNVVKVNFGDPNMTIKKSNPNRRKSFRARHNCDNPGPRWKARYWSCKLW